MTDKEALIRIGQGADRILNDEVAGAAIQNVVDRLKTNWLNSRPDDVLGREAIWRQVHSIQLLTNELQTMRDAGLKAQADIKHAQADSNGKSAYH